MRILVLSAVLALGCRGRASPQTGSIYKFLPQAPDLAVRLELTRLHAWPMYSKVAPIALRKAQKMLDAAKAVCNLDVMTEAKTLVIAKRGTLLEGDLTLVGTGLAKDKVTSCLATLQKTDSQQMLTVDGDVFHVSTNGKSLGSGAFLPTGELVFVIRNGQGVEPAAWKQELAAPATVAPAWWAEMNATDPVSVRVVNSDKRGAFSADLSDPLLVRGSIVASTAEVAKSDFNTYKAIAEYLKQSDAGTPRLELKGETLFADLTAKGPQIERLVTMAVPAVFGTDNPAADAASAAVPPGIPIECASIAGAVEHYMNQALSVSAGAQKAAMEKAIPTLLPRLQKAYVDRCTADSWARSSIECHLANATQLARFEKCRNDLSSDQRDKLDKEISAAVSMSPGAP